jgi:uncharacterized repeat protein (TIGR01451 family)
MFRGNVRHTGQSPYDTSGNNGKLKWRFTTGEQIYSSPVIGSDGTIYVGSDDDNLYAIDSDGIEKWRFTADFDVHSSPAISSDGTIYIASEDKKLYAINQDGTEKWSFMASKTIQTSPAIGIDGTIYFGSHDYKLYAINPDGTEKWNLTTGYQVQSSPSIDSDGIIYVGSHDHNLYAINPDGTEKWSFITNHVIHSSPAIGSDGTVYVGSSDNKLYAINSNGTEKWNYETGHYVVSSPAISFDGTIYIGSHDNRLYAINPDGSEKWNFTTGSTVSSSPAIGSDGTIYIGFNDHKLYAINSDGTEEWNFTTGDWIRSSPAIGSDGTIYIGSADSNLYAIGPSIPDILVEKTANVTTAKPGDLIEYTIYYNNTGSETAAIVWINDTLPEGVTFVTSSTEANRTGDYNWTFYDVKGHLDPTWNGPYLPSSRPSKRTSHALAYDSNNDRMVLFGGDSVGHPRIKDDTWEYDTASHSWYRPYNPTPRPSERENHAMTYDSTNNRVVLFGGAYIDSNDDTWEYDTSTHTWYGPYTPTPRPSERKYHSMAYDPINKRMVLFGGHIGYPVIYDDETWEYDTATHTWYGPFLPSTRPSARYGQGMTFDSSKNRVVLFGGSGYSNDIWEYDTATHTWHGPYMPTPRPSKRIQVDIGYNSVSNRVVMYGGFDGASDDETWEYDASSSVWHGPYTPNPHPPGRSGHEIVYDSTSDRVVLFGGVNKSGLFDDTWEYASPSNGTHDFTITVRIDAGVPNGTVLTNTVNLEFINSSGYRMPSSSASADILVLADEHEPPVAVAGSYQTVKEAEIVEFDGTYSYAPYGTIYRYEWDFDSDVDSDGDGYTSNDVDATGPNPSHVYGDDGVYTVTLNVTSRWETGEVRKDDQDCVFVMDSSGSMVTNDPKNLRIEAAKQYVDKMILDDRACVVDFDTDASLINNDHLGSDYNKIKDNLDQIDANGGTDISTGLDVSIDELINYGDPDHTQVIILITDGGNNDPSMDTVCRNLAATAATNNIIIITIGLTMAVNGTPELLLKDIANITGGKYFPAPNAEYLEAIYEEISILVENYSYGELSDKDTMLVTVENVLPTLDPIGSQVKAVNEVWVARYDGPDKQEDVAMDIAIDLHQNVYVIGSSYSNETYNDYVTVAYDSSGHERWIAKYNGPENGYDEGKVIVLDEIGNIYVSGTSFSNKSNEGETNYDIVTIKYDSFGNELWVARYNGLGNSTDSVEEIAVDSFGNLIVTGSTYSDESYYDIVIIKYDNLGNELWFETYNGPYNNHDRVNALTVDSLDNIYVTGYSYGDGTDKDFITIKYDPKGTRQWNKRYNGQVNYEDSGSDIVVDLMGNVYVTGYCYGMTSRQDYFTLKYDSSGNNLWRRRHNGPGLVRDYANAIALDSNQNVYITGRSFGPDTYFDYCTVKYDTNGYLLWIARYNGPKEFYDNPIAISVDSSGNVFVAGVSFGDSLSYDYALVVYDSQGNQVWVAKYDGEARGDDHAYAMKFDSFGNVYITGMSQQERFNNSDFATIKYSILSHHEYYEGSSINLSASAIDHGSDDLTFIWEWGDGTPNTMTTYYNNGVSPEPVYDSGINEIRSPWGIRPFIITDTVNHIYGDDGIYRMSLTIFDDDSGIYSVSMVITVNNSNPTINSIIAPSGYEASQVTIISTATDPGSDDLTFTWDWGDGTSTEVNTYFNDGKGYEPIYDPIFNEIKTPLGTYPFTVTDTAQHTYWDDGVYTITLTVTDDDGGITFMETDVVINNVAPTITLVMTPSGDEGSSLTLEASATDPGSDDLTFKWDFEFGPTIENTYYNDGIGPDPDLSPFGVCPFNALDIVTHCYGDDYDYNLVLTVTDDDGGVVAYTTTITVDNVAPSITKLTIPYIAHEGTSSLYKATAKDLGSDDLTFEWDFGDSTPLIENSYYNDGTGPDPHPSPEGAYPYSAEDILFHTYGDNYDYILTLSVTDDDGGVTTFKTTVIVNNVAPTIELFGPFNVDEGMPLELVAISTDLGSDDLTFTWEFDLEPTITNVYYNDGSSPDIYPSPWGVYPFEVSEKVSHIYGDNGVFKVTLSVLDDDGGAATFTTNIIVNNVAPTVIPSWPSTIIEEGKSFVLSANSTDLGSDDLIFTWEFELGPTIAEVYYNDGVNSDPYPSPWGTYPFSVEDQVINTYGDNGIYIVTIIVEDDDGGVTTYKTNLTVYNVAPTIEPFGPFLVDESSPIEVTGVGADSGSDDLILTWEFELGPTFTTTHYNDAIDPDPTQSPWGTFPFSITENVAHAYGDNGVFLVTLTVSDDDGGTTTYTTNITVKNVAPVIEKIKAFMYVNISLRVAGEKWHSVNINLYEDDSEIWAGGVTRYPGNPDEQMATITNVKVDMTKSYTAIVDYLPNDPRINGNVWGANPVWIDIEFENGSIARLHHTFNVRQSDWNSDHWNHIDPWEVELNSQLVGYNITFESNATDPGSDDLIFTWDFGDGTTAGPTAYYNNGISPDPYPSPEINPMTATDTCVHSYTTSGTYTITLVVEDDDGGTTVTTLEIGL